MNRISITIRNEDERRRAVAQVVNAPLGWRVDVKPEKRTTEQNAKFWAMLSEVSEQVVWHGVKLPPEDWKYLFLDAYKREIRVVPNIDGNGFVSLGRSSSDLSVSEMADVITLIEMFGANHGVIFKEPESNSPEMRPHRVEADTPDRPHGPPNPGRAAGVTHSEASLLSDDWRHTYFAALTRPGDRKDSLKTRHDQALQMLGGEPTSAELAWMRLAWALVRSRNQNEIMPTEFEIQKTALLAAPLPDVERAA